MDGKDVFKAQIETTRQIVRGTMANVDPEVCQKTPGGKAQPIGATYAHLVMSEDLIVNMMCRGKSPLLMGEWAGKVGISEPPPMPGAPGVFEWANRVKVDLDQVNKYAAAVHAATDEYINSLTPEELGREMEVPGFGKGPVANFLAIGTIIHPSNHIGEISAMKGIQGLQGYPF